MSPLECVEICVCTFRRASVVATLASLSKQSIPSNIRLRVIVADNDDTPSAEPYVRAAAQTLGLDCIYLHAPARNISIARNACLDAVTSDWFAFIDDDETAEENWLRHLLEARIRGDIIFGAARALYSPTAPTWITTNDFHSFDPSKQKTLKSGSTCNVLINRPLVQRHRLRFDPALGRTGGEDTIFFYESHLRGARLVSAASALVYEPVAPQRENRGWLLRRRFRSGQTHALCIARFHPRERWRTALLAAVKTVYCAARACLCLAAPSRAARHIWRAALHAGVVAYSVRPTMLPEYAGAQISAGPPITARSD